MENQNKKKGVDWSFWLILAIAVLAILYYSVSDISPEEGILNHKGTEIENINHDN